MIRSTLYVFAFVAALNGMLLVGLGMRGVRWRSRGVRVIGTVRANGDEPASPDRPGGRMYRFCQVGYRDTAGNERSMRLAADLPVGAEVALVYLPEQPDRPAPASVASYGQLMLGLVVLLLFVLFAAMAYLTS